MRRKILSALFAALSISVVVSGCTANSDSTEVISSSSDKAQTDSTIINESSTVSLSGEISRLDDGLSAVEFSGNDHFAEFLSAGGAVSDAQVVGFVAGYLPETTGFSFGGNPFGCSTLSVESENGEKLFGRNFDWNNCSALIVKSTPDSGYASISTVNTDFIQGISFGSLPSEIQSFVALYAPLDGMNEKGLCVSVNMIQDSDTIEQSTDKPDITTTTAVRLLLNQASTTDEAVELLEQYDMHASMGYMVHFTVADALGNSIAVEYINNEMCVTETAVLTNFYITPGEKYGIGTQQSHTRYDILTETIADGAMSMDDVRDALDSVSKKNFGEFESTEWSIVFNQTTGEARYYHRESYDKAYVFTLG